MKKERRKETAVTRATLTEDKIVFFFFFTIMLALWRQLAFDPSPPSYDELPGSFHPACSDALAVCLT